MERGQIQGFLVIVVLVVLVGLFVFSNKIKGITLASEDLNTIMTTCADASLASAVQDVSLNGRAGLVEEPTLLYSTALKRIEISMRPYMSSCIAKSGKGPFPDFTIKVTSTESGVVSDLTFKGALKMYNQEWTNPAFKSNQATRLKDAYKVFSTYFLSFKADPRTIHITPLTTESEKNGFESHIGKTYRELSCG